ncbi:MAG: HAMP domain-containing sensor histidine kinase [Dermatophilus congolensis]|nr:HAMP domain-containing sensor histidine kinase [Dermatophilus congolensis]
MSFQAPGSPQLSQAKERLADSFRNKSLTWRLVAVLVVLLLLALTMSNLATSAIMRRYLVDRAVEDLQTAAAPVAERVLPQYLNRQQTSDLPSSYVVFFMDSAGNRMATMAPPGVDAADIPALPSLPLTDARVISHEPFAVSSAGAGPAWIAIAGELGNDSGTYAVATSLAGVEKTINKTIAASFSLGLLLVAVCVTVGWLGFRRAFRPLRSIEDTASAIAAGDLTRRVPEHAAHDEVASLSRSLNAMLAQIEQSFRVREASQQRMRRFVTDASHELRTPLATVRGYAELYRQGAASSPEQTAAAMSRIENEATRMAGLVDDLLTLARLDDERPMRLATIDLTVLAADAVQDARVREPQRDIRLLGIGPSGLRPTDVVGDEARLRQVVTNLVANALSHTPAGTAIEVAVGHDAERARLEVRDHGPGIPPETATKVFERFYRDDPARGRKPSGGYGLGLAIVAAIVESHGGRVGVATTPGGGATFVVEFALAPVADDADDDAGGTDETDDGASATVDAAAGETRHAVGVRSAPRRAVALLKRHDTKRGEAAEDKKRSPIWLIPSRKDSTGGSDG